MYRSVNYNGYCRLLHPYAKVVCHLDYRCEYCDVAARIQQNKREQTLDVDEPLFTCRDALKMTPKANGSDFYFRPVILKPESMTRLGIKSNLINQIFFCDGGSGIFPCNPAGMIDGYLVSDRKERFTITRHDVYGVPNGSAVQRYFDLFGINLNKEAKENEVAYLF